MEGALIRPSGVQETEVDTPSRPKNFMPDANLLLGVARRFCQGGEGLGQRDGPAALVKQARISAGKINQPVGGLYLPGC